MGRSYLFPGRDTKTLTPEQYELEKKYDEIDTRGHRITPDIFFKSPEYAQWLNTRYGDLTSQVPPGSQIVNSTPFKIEYKDAEGYTHTLTRGGADAISGQLSKQTDRPNILPNKGNNDIIAQLQSRLAQSFDPTKLAELPPEVAAQLQQISDAEKARIGQQGEDERGKLISQLYGNRVNQSSIANDAAARFAQQLGLVNQQQSSDAASRTLGVRQYLTNAGLQQNQDLGSLLASLSGQQSQRDIAGAGIGLDQQRLDEMMREFNKNYGLGQVGLELQKQGQDQANSPFNKFLKVLSATSGLASAAGTAYSAYKGRT
jgi:hypothetical protein